MKRINIDPRTILGNPGFDKAKGKRTALRKKNWDLYLLIHERTERPQAFVEIAPRLTNAEYWQLLSWIWSDTEFVFRDRLFWEESFASNRPEREQFMDEEERAFLASLPDPVIVYRGYRAEVNNEHGLSWTLDRAVAERLGNRVWVEFDDWVASPSPYGTPNSHI